MLPAATPFAGGRRASVWDRAPKATSRGRARWAVARVGVPLSSPTITFALPGFLPHRASSGANAGAIGQGGGCRTAAQAPPAPAGPPHPHSCFQIGRLRPRPGLGPCCRKRSRPPPRILLSDQTQFLETQSWNHAHVVGPSGLLLETFRAFTRRCICTTAHFYPECLEARPRPSTLLHVAS